MPTGPLFAKASCRTVQIDDVREALRCERFGERPDAAMVCKEQNLIGLAELGEQIER